MKKEEGSAELPQEYLVTTKMACHRHKHNNAFSAPTADHGCGGGLLFLFSFFFLNRDF